LINLRRYPRVELQKAQLYPGLCHDALSGHQLSRNGSENPCLGFFSRIPIPATPKALHDKAQVLAAYFAAYPGYEKRPQST
jgi:hypothetical protein